jgi:hypothetical protein
MRTITLFLLVGTLAGCASTNLTSVQTAANVHPSGTTYSLPTARVTAQLIYQPQRGFALRVALPPFIPDPTSGFYSIGYRGSAVEADKVQVEVEDGLLKSVNIASESKLLDAVQGGGESIGAIAAVLETSVTSGSGRYTYHSALRPNGGDRCCYGRARLDEGASRLCQGAARVGCPAR